MARHHTIQAELIKIFKDNKSEKKNTSSTPQRGAKNFEQQLLNT
jgi:hypothetical protein